MICEITKRDRLHYANTPSNRTMSCTPPYMYPVHGNTVTMLRRSVRVELRCVYLWEDSMLKYKTTFRAAKEIQRVLPLCMCSQYSGTKWPPQAGNFDDFEVV